MKRWICAQKEELASWVKISKESKRPEKTRWGGFMRELEHFMPSIKPSDAVLDLGCGPDGLIFYFPKQGLRVGLDPLINSYAIYFKVSKEVSLVKGVGENLPLRDNCLDLIFCINTLDHTISPKEILRNMWKTLKIRGFLLLNVNTEPLLDLFAMKLGYQPPLSEYHPHRFLPMRVVQDLKEVGFDIHRVILKGPIPHHIILGAFSKIKSSVTKSNTPKLEIYDVSSKQWIKFMVIRILDSMMYLILKRYFSGEILVLASKA